MRSSTSPPTSSDSRVHYEEAGPTLLAREPPEIEGKPPRLEGWPELFEHGERRLIALRNWRYSWWLSWQRKARVLLPYRYKWVVTANTMNRGNPINGDINDSTPTRAMRICAAGLQNGLMSRSRPWFRFDAALPGYEIDTDGRAWLDDTADRVAAVLGNSNFYTGAATFFTDLTAFATSPMIIYEDREDIIRCYVPCAGEYYLATGARLSVDTLYREFTYTVSQIVDWFGLENCPEEVRLQWREHGGSTEQERVVCCAIEPNFALRSAKGDGQRISPVSGRFPFREWWWIRGVPGDGPLSIRGFNDRPFVAGRWSVTSNDPYGRGPSDDGLGDCDQLQHEQLRKAEFIDKGVRPPMGANPDMENRPSTIIPGGITFTNTQNGAKGFWPLYMPDAEWMAPLTADIAEVQKRINETWFVDVFLAITQMEGIQPKNEMELAQRLAEKVQRLGPVIDLFEDEVASPAIQRVISIMTRRGMFRPMPESLARVGIKVEYTSILRMMQRAAETASMERGATVLGEIGATAINAGLPNPARIINYDKWARIYLDRLNFPGAAIHSESEVEQGDQQRMQQAQQKQLLDAVPAAATAAQSLGSIDVGGGQNAVQALLGTQPAQGGQPQPGAR